MPRHARAASEVPVSSSADQERVGNSQRVISLSSFPLNLAGALAALFKGPAPAAPPSASPPGAPAKTALAGPEADRAREALSHYNGAVQQLKSGNWAGFGAELDALRPFLEELSQHSTGR
jgi:hypothetical protein